jgi:hypothetical protein
MLNDLVILQRRHPNQDGDDENHNHKLNERKSSLGGARKPLPRWSPLNSKL